MTRPWRSETFLTDPDGAQNPFVETGGEYQATRSLDLGSRGALTVKYNVEEAGEDLRATFDVIGKADVPELMAIEPTVETWTPEGPGQSLRSVRFREIRIEIERSLGSLRQKDRIVLFTSAFLTKALG